MSDKFRIISKDFYSNCLIEALKAKFGKQQTLLQAEALT